MIDKSTAMVNVELHQKMQIAKTMELVPLRQLDKLIKYRYAFAQLPQNEYTEETLEKINQMIKELLGV